MLSIQATGLTKSQAEERLRRFGPNRVTGREGASWWLILVRQYTSVLILILVIAAGIALIMGEIIDAFAIALILVLNGVLGFVQEWRAERTLDSLRAMLSARALVIRDGIERRIDAELLVPDDLVILEAGDRVPADLALVQASALLIDESILTGESESVAKSVGTDIGPTAAGDEADRPSTDQLFMGTTVSEGRGRGVVVATGMRTTFGQIADLTRSVTGERTHLQSKLDRLARFLGVFALFLGIFVVTAGWLGGKALGDMVLTGLSLAVAVVPEGLPAVVTVTLAIGARAMQKRRALSRRLQATETLGAASVICTDKTGTLTENQMTVVEIWTPSGSVQATGTGYDPMGHYEQDGVRFDAAAFAPTRDLLTTAMICNHAHIETVGDTWQKAGEPTEAALVVAGYKAWLPVPDHDLILREIPFSSDRKRMSVMVRDGDRHRIHAKGAPEAIVPICTTIASEARREPLDDAARGRIEAAYETLAGQGLRVLAVACGEAEGAAVSDVDMEAGLTFLGLVAIIDPPRREVPDAVASARAAGIDVVMITGDAPTTALAIARMIGLDAERAVTGPMLEEMDEAALSAFLVDGAVFARTTPAHKMRIINNLQADGRIIAMTGDGVNDAPALKRADIGIAMGIRGTDVAKDASDLILLDDNFATIVGAIEEGRRQYGNIQKFVRFLLASNAGEVTAIVANLMIGGPLIFLPIQILWMNLVTDGPTALTLGLERGEDDIMERPPRPAGAGMVGRDGFATIAAFGLYTGAACLIIFYIALPFGVVFAQTAAFTALVLFEKLSVFTFRSLNLPWSRIGFLSNPTLLLAVCGIVALQVAAVHWPPLQLLLGTTALDLETWGLIALFALPIVIVPEAIKRIKSR